jgi:hypothetical protein
MCPIGAEMLPIMLPIGWCRLSKLLEMLTGSMEVRSRCLARNQVCYPGPNQDYFSEGGGCHVLQQFYSIPNPSALQG